MKASPYKEGKKYWILYQSATQRRPREAVMVFLEETETHIIFSARPAAGTQRIPRYWMIGEYEVPDDTPVYTGRLTRKSE